MRGAMQLVRSVLVAFAISGAGPTYAEEPPAANTNTVVAVRAFHTNNVLAQGSAVRIAVDKLVTNCHVTSGAQRVEIIQNGRQVPVRVESQAIGRDICVLKGAELDDFVPPRKLAAKAGQNVYAVGFPADRSLTVSRGRVIALHDHDSGQVIQVSAPFDYGSSGGGLFDEEGQLVGILAFKARAGGSFHFALPVAWLDGKMDITQGQDVPAHAFWQAQGRDLPYFLRAVSLEATGRWQALESLAREWTHHEPHNDGAWRALQNAHLRNGFLKPPNPSGLQQRRSLCVKSSASRFAVAAFPPPR